MVGIIFKEKRYEQIFLLVFLLMVFLLAVTKIQDVDAWLHLSSGKAMWENKGFPDAEPYVYTMAGKPFAHGAWAFAVLYYMAYHFFGVYGITLLKAASIAIAFFLLFMDALRPHRSYVVGLAVLAVVVVVTRHRFVERPDTLLMVYLPFSILALNAFVYDNKKYLYLLPLIHLLWANSHTSIVLMTVPFAAFIGGGIIEIYGAKKGIRFEATPDISQLKKIATIFALSFAASLINPFFVKQYFLGAQFMGVDFFKQEINELLPPTWQTEPIPFILAGIVIGSFILNWTVRYVLNRRAGAERALGSYTPLVHFLLVLPFLYLQFTAVRFIFLFAVISGPIVARNVSSLILLWKERNPVSRPAASGLTGPAIVLSIFVLNGTLTLANVPLFTYGDHLHRFGFGFDPVNMPEGALRYMDEKDIQGRVFNIYQWGQYISWRDHPKRTPFVDGRGYIPIEILEPMRRARHVPAELERLYARYGFESILVQYLQPVEGAPVLDKDESLNSPAWALVYWDDMSLLYLRRGGRYDRVIRDDEYRLVRPANGIRSIRISTSNSGDRENYIRELQRSIKQTGSFKAYAFLGQVYNDMGLYNDAIDAFSRVESNPVGQDHIRDRYNGIAYAFSQLGRLDEAIRSYRKALKYGADATLYYSLGVAYIKKGERRKAIRALNQAIALNKSLVSAYPLLKQLYHEENRNEDAQRTDEFYQQALQLNQGEEHFKKGLQAYWAGNAQVAAEEFGKSIEKNASTPVPYSNLGYIYFDMGQYNRSYEYQRRAIDIDPYYANAYYGVGLIYKVQGNHEAAEKYFTEYLALEPSGYYARKAKEYIEKIAADTRKGRAKAVDK